MVNKGLQRLRIDFPWPEEIPSVPEDNTGWFNERKAILLKEEIPEDAKVIVELGSWLGQSTRWFLNEYKRADIIAVDTWLGSAEHLSKSVRTKLPMLHETFLRNCWKYRGRLIPFRNTSLAALQYLHKLKIKPDVIYFDSDHSYWGLMAELETAHKLFPKALMVGDDFEEGNSVANAVHTFTEYSDSRGMTEWRGWDYETKYFSWSIDKGDS